VARWELAVADDWFEIRRITDDLFILHEPRHFEKTNVSLLIGREMAVLIDTGCGIGDLGRAVERLTEKPVSVINTHTHLDHIGGNRHFEEIALFDHPRSRQLAAHGAPREILEREILDEKLLTGPWPEGFDPRALELSPFEVNRWLKDGERIRLGDIELEAIHTPGEAPDHICLLDRAHRVLYCGDILLHGAIWTHLEGGSLSELIASYQKLMGYYDEFDHLMPSHNEPWIDRQLLPAALAAAERIVAGEIRPEETRDPWGRRLHRYSFGQFEILTGR